jgi:hypothetical protein
VSSLLAVDLGLKTGLALYGDDGRLRWYRSHHYGTRGQLRRGVWGMLEELSGLRWIVLEGGGPLAEIWKREADRRGIATLRISAEDWRSVLFKPGQHRDRDRSKSSAETLARRVIDWSAAPRPVALRHDTAEAILIGLWGVLRVGWLPAIPRELGG